MNIKTKKEAIASIKTRSHVVKGKKYTSYDVYIGVNSIKNRAERLYAPTREELLKKIERFYDGYRKAGDLASVLSARQTIDAQEAFRLLDEAKDNTSLVECVRVYLEHAGIARIYDKTIGHCYDLFYRSKPEGYDKNKTARTTGLFVQKVGPDRIISSITQDEIESYLKTNYDDMADVTYNSHLSYLFTFFNWCAKPKQRFVPENPMLRIEKKAVAWKDPKYLPVEDTQKLFAALDAIKHERPDLVAQAVLSFFTGTRREEILRMAQMDNAAKILIEDCTIRISKVKGYTRGRAPRSFEIMPNAMQWLKSFDYEKGIRGIDYQTTDKLADFALKHGVKLFRNCARHSFITMHVAAFGIPQKTQAMVGTSAKMRAEHYDGLATRREGEAYFAICPAT